LKKEAKTLAICTRVWISATNNNEEFFGSFLKKQLRAFWAGAGATPIRQDSGSRLGGVS
jgi:hypothetical protein